MLWRPAGSWLDFAFSLGRIHTPLSLCLRREILYLNLLYFSNLGENKRSPRSGVWGTLSHPQGLTWVSVCSSLEGATFFLRPIAAPRRPVMLAGSSWALPNQREGLPNPSLGQAWAAAHIYSDWFQLHSAWLAWPSALVMLCEGKGIPAHSLPYPSPLPPHGHLANSLTILTSISCSFPSLSSFPIPPEHTVLPFLFLCIFSGSAFISTQTFSLSQGLAVAPCCFLFLLLAHITSSVTPELSHPHCSF